MRRPTSTVRTREPAERKLEYYIDSLGTEEIEIDKGRFREMLQGIPVRVVLDTATPLYGAARYAAERC